MDATLTHIGLTNTRKPLRPAIAVKQSIRRVCAAIAAGPGHPAFRTPDAASRLVLTTRGEQSRNLNAGLCSARW